MRRPAAFLFAAFAGGILTGYYLNLWIAALFWGLLFLAALLWGKYPFAVFLLIALVGAFYYEAMDTGEEEFHEYQGRVVSLAGKVLSSEKRDGYVRMLMDPDIWRCGDTQGAVRGKIIINLTSFSSGQDGEAVFTEGEIMDMTGKEVRLKGRLSLPPTMRNPGLFDYRLYLKTRGITAVVNAHKTHVEIIGQANSLTAVTAKVKSRFSASLHRYMSPDSKAVLLGILFGDKTYIGEEIYEDFQRNGCAHILSVSGIHVSILYLYISMLFPGRRNPAGSAITLVLLLIYAALADFSPSVVRAVVMIAIHILSKHLHRRYDLLCCISFSAFLMLLWNPYSLFNLGFQLSYLAVFTLAFALPHAERTIGRLEGNKGHGWLSALLRAFLPIFAIQVGMAPATAYHFQYFSLSAFLVNLPVIALAGAILPLGMLLILLCYPGGTLFGLGATGADLLIRVMLKINRVVGDISFSSMNITGPHPGLLVLFYGLFFFILSEGFRSLWDKKEKQGIILICVLIVWISAATPFIIDDKGRGADIVFLDVGQGDCIHLRTPQGKNILIDGGGDEDYDTGKKILLPYLLKNGEDQVDLAIVTHLHQDHYGGIASLCRLMPVKKLALYTVNALQEETILTDTGLAAEDLVYLAGGDRIQVEKDIYIDVLYPFPAPGEKPRLSATAEEEENLCSLVLRVRYGGITLLITGDMGFEGERLLMDSLEKIGSVSLKSDVLKVGHHGSRFSTGDDFLKAVDPKVAVIQVGKNNFGHPNPQVIEKLEEKGIMVVRNDQSGAILLYIDRNSVRISTML